VWYQLIPHKRLQSHYFTLGIARNSQGAEDSYCKAQANLSRDACVWEQQKWDHSYVRHHCEKNSEENCLDWDNNTVFSVYKNKTEVLSTFSGTDPPSIIGTGGHYSSREKLLKMGKDKISSFYFFSKSKNTEQTNLTN